MTILDTAILNLMKELENKEISWEEYKLKLILNVIKRWMIFYSKFLFIKSR